MDTLRSALLLVLWSLTAAQATLPLVFANRKTRQDGYGPEVTVEQGRLLGRTLVTIKGTPYTAFSGIPYAAPPLGDLRFKGPRPAASWAGVRDARNEGRICTQPLVNITRILLTRIPKSIEPLHSSEIPGLVRAQPWLLRFISMVLTSGEDCLFLNVYTPRLAARVNRAGGGKGLPVLFWIHGGGFVWGDGGMALYDPDNLMERDVVVVTINYRLGALGLLSLGRGSGVSGNAAVKDIAAALRWVRRNIAAFGGDPDKITVWGESAGAVFAHLLMLSPDTSRLFRGVILGSGSAVHFWSSITAQHALKRGRHMAARVQCRSDLAPPALAKCLRKVPAQRLAMAHEGALLPQDQRYATGNVPFVPVIEEVDENLGEFDKPFLTEDPRDLLASGRYAKVPVIVGFNSGESLIMFTGLTLDPSIETLRRMDRNITCLLRDDLIQRMPPTEAADTAHRVRRFYFGNEDPVKPYGKSLDTFFEMGTSLFIYLDSLMMIRMMASHPDSAPVYMYNFKFVGAFNMFKNILRLKQREACHGDELPYVWNVHVNFNTYPVTDSSPEVKLQRSFSTMVANFVRTGSPTPDPPRPNSNQYLNLNQNLTWPPFTVHDQAYLDIGSEMRVQKNYKPATIALWDRIYAKWVGGPIWETLANIEAQRSGTKDDSAIGSNLVNS